MTVDIFIVIFVGLLFILGYKKGFIRTFFDTLGVVVSFFLSKELYFHVENFLLKNTKLFVKMYDFFQGMFSESVVNSFNNIPVELQKFANSIIMAETQDTYTAFIDNISLLTIRTISFLITFLALYAVLLFLSTLIDTIMKLPVLNLTNRILGGLTGILKAVVILYIVFALSTPLIGFMQDKPLMQSILNSESSRIFYDNNILLNYLSYKGFYEK